MQVYLCDQQAGKTVLVSGQPHRDFRYITVPGPTEQVVKANLQLFKAHSLVGIKLACTADSQVVAMMYDSGRLEAAASLLGCRRGSVPRRAAALLYRTGRTDSEFDFKKSEWCAQHVLVVRTCSLHPGAADSGTCHTAGTARHTRFANRCTGCAHMQATPWSS